MKIVSDLCPCAGIMVACLEGALRALNEIFIPGHRSPAFGFSESTVSGQQGREEREHPDVVASEHWVTLPA
jgi:hypothetical protein